MRMFASRFPETTFRAEGSVPRIVLFEALTSLILASFRRCTIPEVSVPMKQPCMTLPPPLSSRMPALTPTGKKRLMTSPLTVLPPAVILRPLALLLVTPLPFSSMSRTALSASASVLACAPGCE